MQSLTLSLPGRQKRSRRIAAGLKKPPGLKSLNGLKGSRAKRPRRRTVSEILNAAYRRHCRDRETLDALRLCLEEEEGAAASS